MTRPAKDGDDSGGADSGGNLGTCEKKGHGSKAMVRDNELYKEGKAEAETKQKELKRVKRAKRNATERDRKKEKAGTSQAGYLEKHLRRRLLPTKVMKARRTLVMEQATGLVAVWHSKMRSKPKRVWVPSKCVQVANSVNLTDMIKDRPMKDERFLV